MICCSRTDHAVMIVTMTSLPTAQTINYLGNRCNWAYTGGAHRI